MKKLDFYVRITELSNDMPWLFLVRDLRDIKALHQKQN